MAKVEEWAVERRSFFYTCRAYRPDKTVKDKSMHTSDVILDISGMKTMNLNSVVSTLVSKITPLVC